MKCLQIEQKYADILVLHLAQVWASRLIFMQKIHVIKHIKRINGTTALMLSNLKYLEPSFFLTPGITIVMKSTVSIGDRKPLDFKRMPNFKEILT